MIVGAFWWLKFTFEAFKAVFGFEEFLLAFECCNVLLTNAEAFFSELL